MRQTSFRSTWLPLGLAGIALIMLNLGLYYQLGAQVVKPSFEFPYAEDFASISDVPYEEFGGDWEIRDQALVQMSTSGYDLTAYIPLEVPAEDSYSFAAKLRFLGGSMGGGLIFNAQQTTSRQKSHMVRFNVDGGQLWLIYGYFGDDSNFNGQGSVLLDLAPDDAAAHELRVQVGPESYALYLDEVLVATDIPLAYKGGAVGFISSTSQMAFDDIRVDYSTESVPASPAAQPAEPSSGQPEAPVEVPQVLTGDVPVLDAFDGGAGGESLWKPVSGDWRYEAGQYVQTQPDGFDLSTIYQQPITPPLMVEAVFQHREGAGAGLLINLPSPDSRNGGTMVRYMDGGEALAWGYFAEDGVFSGQGGVQVTPPGTAPHTLTISVTASTYAITLDGVEIARDIPLLSPVTPAYIGLTASESIAAFDEVRLLTGEAVQPVPQEPVEAAETNIDAEAATGTWIVDGTIITQTDTANADYIAGTGLAGEQFSVTVDIDLPLDVPDAGAGIVFHMQGRDDPRMGHMVRFGNGGQELFWGSYDADGVFNGEGGVPLDLPANETVKLHVVVRVDSFDIYVNDQVAVEAIPLQQASGWIGLISYGGPVTFSNVNVQLGG